MQPLDEVIASVLRRCEPLQPRKVPVGRALGCVAAEPVVAPAAIPPFTNSAMDGFAVRSADVAGAGAETPVHLAVSGTLNAGAAPGPTVGPWQAVRIMTGAALPDGADAVVMVENTLLTPRDDGLEVVAVAQAVAPGQHVRSPGSDVEAGTEVIAAGTILGAAHIGILGEIGATEVPAVPRPRVGVISTGDELVPPTRAPGPGQIHDSNRPMLLAAVTEVGAVPVDLGWCPDDPDALVAALKGAATRCDLMLTSGGVSMGDADVVKMVLPRLGEHELFRVAIRPAKPFAVAVVEGVPLLGLPGNPVSALVAFSLLARPAIRRRAGHRHLHLPRIAAAAGGDLSRRVDGKVHFVRVRLAGEPGRWTAEPIVGQGSHQLVAAAGADGLAVVPDGDGIPAGGEVEVVVLDATRALSP